MANFIASSSMKVISEDEVQRQLFASVCVLVAWYSTQLEIATGVILLVMHRSITANDFTSL